MLKKMSPKVAKNLDNFCMKLSLQSVQPYWAIYCTLGTFSKFKSTIKKPKLPTCLGNFCKGVKIFIFLVKSFLSNFYRHLATFYWSHCRQSLSKIVQSGPTELTIVAQEFQFVTNFSCITFSVTILGDFLMF